MKHIRAARVRNRRHLMKKSYTVEEWIQEWYQKYKEPKHAETTKQVQKTYIKCHIIPHIGHMVLPQVETSHMQDLLSFLLREGNQGKLKYSSTQGNPLAPWTVKKIRSLLISAFDAAVKENLISTNPVRNAESIKLETLHVSFFTLTQQDLFLNYTKNHRFHVAYQLLFHTGCRRSEILGLAWDCIDFDQNQIHIRRALVSINGEAHLKEYPKTKASVRTIPVHPHIMKLLKVHKEKQIEESKSHDTWSNKPNLIFCNRDGSPHSPTYFLHNFKCVIRKLGLPSNLKIHSTRHTFATNLLQIGVPITDVQHLGGWSDTRVILDIYAHTVQESHRTAIKKLYDHTTKKGENKL